MKKDFVPYKIALALKELGFDEPSFGRFYIKPKCKVFSVDEKGRHYQIKNTPKKLYTVGGYFVLNDDNAITAPTFSQALKFFRDKYNIDAKIKKDMAGVYYGKKRDNEFPFEYNVITGGFDTFEEAEKELIEKLIELYKKN